MQAYKIIRTPLFSNSALLGDWRSLYDLRYHHLYRYVYCLHPFQLDPDASVLPEILDEHFHCHDVEAVIVARESVVYVVYLNGWNFQWRWFLCEETHPCW